MNDLVDNMVDDELHRAIREDVFVHANFPFEKLRVKSNGEKLTGNLRKSLDTLQGERTARKHFDAKNIVHGDDFSCVWWDGMEDLMKGYPKCTEYGQPNTYQVSAAQTR